MGGKFDATVRPGRNHWLEKLAGWAKKGQEHQSGGKAELPADRLANQSLAAEHSTKTEGALPGNGATALADVGTGLQATQASELAQWLATKAPALPAGVVATQGGKTLSFAWDGRTNPALREVVDAAKEVAATRLTVLLPATQQGEATRKVLEAFELKPFPGSSSDPVPSGFLRFKAELEPPSVSTPGALVGEALQVLHTVGDVARVRLADGSEHFVASKSLERAETGMLSVFIQPGWDGFQPDARIRTGTPASNVTVGMSPAKLQQVVPTLKTFGEAGAAGVDFLGKQATTFTLPNGQSFVLANGKAAVATEATGSLPNPAKLSLLSEADAKALQAWATSNAPYETRVSGLAKAGHTGKAHVQNVYLPDGGVHSNVWIQQEGKPTIVRRHSSDPSDVSWVEHSLVDRDGVTTVERVSMFDGNAPDAVTELCSQKLNELYAGQPFSPNTPPPTLSRHVTEGAQRRELYQLSIPGKEPLYIDPATKSWTSPDAGEKLLEGAGAESIGDTRVWLYSVGPNGRTEGGADKRLLARTLPGAVQKAIAESGAGEQLSLDVADAGDGRKSYSGRNFRLLTDAAGKPLPPEPQSTLGKELSDFLVGPHRNSYTMFSEVRDSRPDATAVLRLWDGDHRLHREMLSHTVYLELDPTSSKSPRVVKLSKALAEQVVNDASLQWTRPNAPGAPASGTERPSMLASRPIEETLKTEGFEKTLAGLQKHPFQPQSSSSKRVNIPLPAPGEELELRLDSSGALSFRVTTGFVNRPTTSAEELLYRQWLQTQGNWSAGDVGSANLPSPKSSQDGRFRLWDGESQPAVPEVLLSYLSKRFASSAPYGQPLEVMAVAGSSTGGAGRTFAVYDPFTKKGVHVAVAESQSAPNVVSYRTEPGLNGEHEQPTPLLSAPKTLPGQPANGALPKGQLVIDTRAERGRLRALEEDTSSGLADTHAVSLEELRGQSVAVRPFTWGGKAEWVGTVQSAEGNALTVVDAFGRAHVLNLSLDQVQLVARP